MNNKVTILTTEIWDLLGSKAVDFAYWLEKANTKESIAINHMLNNSPFIDLNSPLILNHMIPLLLSLDVIDQSVVERVNTYINYRRVSDYE